MGRWLLIQIFEIYKTAKTEKLKWINSYSHITQVDSGCRHASDNSPGGKDHTPPWWCPRQPGRSSPVTPQTTPHWDAPDYHTCCNYRIIGTREHHSLRNSAHRLTKSKPMLLKTTVKHVLPNNNMNYLTLQPGLLLAAREQKVWWNLPHELIYCGWQWTSEGVAHWWACKLSSWVPSKLNFKQLQQCCQHRHMFRCAIHPDPSL